MEKVFKNKCDVFSLHFEKPLVHQRKRTNPRTHEEIFLKKRCTHLLHLKSIISKLQSKFQLFISVYLATEPLSKVLSHKQTNKSVTIKIIKE